VLRARSPSADAQQQAGLPFWSAPLVVERASQPRLIVPFMQSSTSRVTSRTAGIGSVLPGVITMETTRIEHIYEDPHRQQLMDLVRCLAKHSTRVCVSSGGDARAARQLAGVEPAWVRKTPTGGNRRARCPVECVVAAPSKLQRFIHQMASH
jgi:hypothetical protein